MSRYGLVATILLLAGLPQQAHAQQRWSVDVRGGTAFPTQNLGGTDLSEGLGLEATVSYRLMPHLAAYGGWDWLRFAADQSFAGSDMDFEETGYAFGVQFDHPFRGETDGAAYRIRMGATYNHIEVEDADGDIVADSGHGLGWEVGTGVVLPFGDAWRFTPGIRYRSLGRALEVAGTSTNVDLVYVALELGFARRF